MGEEGGETFFIGKPGSGGFKNRIGGIESLSDFSFPSVDTGDMTSGSGPENASESGSENVPVQVNVELGGKSQEQESKDAIEVKIAAAFDEVFSPEKFLKEIEDCLANNKDRDLENRKEIAMQVAESLKQNIARILGDGIGEHESLDEIGSKIRREMKSMDLFFDFNPEKKPEWKKYELNDSEEVAIRSVVKNIAGTRKIAVAVLDEAPKELENDEKVGVEAAPTAMAENGEVGVDERKVFEATVSPEAIAESQGKKQKEAEKIWKRIKKEFALIVSGIFDELANAQELSMKKSDKKKLLESITLAISNDVNGEIGPAILEKMFSSKDSLDDFELSGEERIKLTEKIGARISDEDLPVEKSDRKTKKDISDSTEPVLESKLEPEAGTLAAEEEVELPPIQEAFSEVPVVAEAEGVALAEGGDQGIIEKEKEEHLDPELQKIKDIFEKAISVIEDLSVDEFEKEYGSRVKPVLYSDYRDLFGKEESFFLSHPNDIADAAEAGLLYTGLEIARNLNKEGHGKRLVVVDGLTYLVDKKPEKGGFIKFENKAKEIGAMKDVAVEYYNAFKNKYAEGELIGELLTEDGVDEHLRLKTKIFLIKNIAKKYKCSHEIAQELAVEIVQALNTKNK